MLAASIYFYAISAWWYLVPFFVTALLDFFVGQKIEGSDDEAYRKRMLVVSVVANLGLLSVFKYTGWISSDLSRWLAPLASLFGAGGVIAATCHLVLYLSVDELHDRYLPS